MRRFVLMCACVGAALGGAGSAHAVSGPCTEYGLTVVSGYPYMVSAPCDIGQVITSTATLEVATSPLHGFLTEGIPYWVRTYRSAVGYVGPDDIAIRLDKDGVRLGIGEIHLNVVANTPPMCPDAPSFRTVPGRTQRYNLRCTDDEPGVPPPNSCCQYEIAQQPAFGPQPSRARRWPTPPPGMTSPWMPFRSGRPTSVARSRTSG